MKSELITAQHLANKAIIYVRQSTLHQTLNNQESLKLQYELKQKASELGWATNNIEIIDSDLGLTGAAAEHRTGFKDILTQVALGKVGVILSYDVTRLSRNCSDWYPLLDLCGYKQCLIADRDGIYDPGTTNGRLLLGLKGQLAEVELTTIRARLTAGLLNKAKRGDLALQLPVGLLRNVYHQVDKDPNLEIQNRILLIFDTFLRVKSASKTLRFFNDNELRIPRYNSFRQLNWKKPSIAAITFILKNPAYAGAFAYGRSRVVRNGPSVVDKAIKRLPQNEWKILVHNKYPAYIIWETFEKIQLMLKDNYAEYDRNKTRGIPRNGEALLHGIVYCGECGHKMMVQYKTGTQYLCNALRQRHGTTVCQFIPGNPVDNEVVKNFFAALSSIELDAYNQTIAIQNKVDDSVQKAHAQQLERLRYQAQLAQRQFNQVDPDNRLVAAELEKRWESALQELANAQAAFNQQKQQVPAIELPEKLRLAFVNVGKNLPELWSKTISQAQKKAFLRCLIDKVVIHRPEPDTVHIRIIWQGGQNTIIDIPVTVGSLSRLSSAKAMKDKIIMLSQEGKSDESIAQQLTEEGFRSPMKQEVLVSTVRIIRIKQRILRNTSQSHPRRIQGFLTVPQLSQVTNIPPHWIYDKIHNGQIQIDKIYLPGYKNGLFLFPDNSETITMIQLLRDNKTHNSGLLKGVSR